jgi:transcription initiation factor TFIIE subunit beta
LSKDVVYSQPADTGTGANINTQLVYCVDHLKVLSNAVGILCALTCATQSMGGPTRLQDIAIMTGTPLMENALLLEKFKAHDRVIYNPKSETYQYKVCHVGIRA